MTRAMHDELDSEEVVLIAVSNQKSTPDAAWNPSLPERPYKFVIRSDSKTSDANFIFESGPLVGRSKENCLNLEKHGFTVVEVSRN